jgi:hypothetical protein
MMFDPIKIVQVRISSAALVDSDATAPASNEVDLAPYAVVGKRSIVAVWAPIILGTDTDETYDNEIQESDTTASSDFATISGANFTQVTPETDAAFQSLTLVATKRYVRSLLTLGGTTASIRDATALVVMGRFDT